MIPQRYSYSVQPRGGDNLCPWGKHFYSLLLRNENKKRKNTFRIIILSVNLNFGPLPFAFKYTKKCILIFVEKRKYVFKISFEKSSNFCCARKNYCNILNSTIYFETNVFHHQVSWWRESSDNCLVVLD